MGTYCDECTNKITTTYKPTTCDCWTKLNSRGFLVNSLEGFCRHCWEKKFKNATISACASCGHCSVCGVKFQKDKVEID